jgi:hypothetical protein
MAVKPPLGVRALIGTGYRKYQAKTKSSTRNAATSRCCRSGGSWWRYTRYVYPLKFRPLPPVYVPGNEDSTIVAVGTLGLFTPVECAVGAVKYGEKVGVVENGVAGNIVNGGTQIGKHRGQKRKNTKASFGLSISSSISTSVSVFAPLSTAPKKRIKSAAVFSKLDE